MPSVLCHKKVWTLAFLIVLSSTATVHAQNVTFAPDTGEYSVGQTFSVRIRASSPNQAFNAIEGHLTFPVDKLQVVSISKAETSLNLWVQEPAFSNSAGTIDFAGIVLNPGYQGPSARILTINFKAINSGTANLNFSSVTLLANDGNGTNIANTPGSATFTISPGTVQAAPTTLTADLLITSPSHPDPRKWYTAKDAKFNFQFPDSATELRLGFDRQPTSAPIVKHSPPIKEREVLDIDEGVWYMHARYLSPDGLSSTVHFRVNIDHTPPSSFEISEAPDRDKALAQVPLFFTASDDISAIDHYEVSIDGGQTENWKDDGDGIFLTPELLSGNHTITAAAVDSAGNKKYAAYKFDVLGLDAPTITDYTKTIKGGESVVVRGMTYPDFTVRLYVEDSGKLVKVAEAKSDQTGQFVIDWDATQEELTTGVLRTAGKHKMSVNALSSEGRITKQSSAVSFTFYRLLSRFSQSMSDLLVILIPALALLFILILIILLILYILRKISRFRKDVRREIHEAKVILHRSFDLLREDLSEYVITLEKAKIKRQLTREEKQLMRRLKQNLQDAENAIDKELGDVSKKVGE